MRKNRKNSSRTRGNRICIAAFLLICSLMLGGCGVKKEKAADSELPEIVIGMDYFEPYSYQASDGKYKGIDVELAKEAFQRLGYQPKFENIVWSEIQTLSDLKGKRIAVQATTKAEDLFLHNIKSDLPQMQQVNCFSTTNEIYAALRKNYVDAIAGHEAMLGSLVKEGKNAYRMLDESIYKSELGVAFKKGTHEEVAADLTETLKKLQREGITEKIV